MAVTEYLRYIKSKEYWRKAVSATERVAGVKEYVMGDGSACGMKAIDVYTGSGFEFTVIPDRGMDIADARFGGVPVAYIPKYGIRNPVLCFVGAPGEFSRYFMGGLVMTCGLDNAGDACMIDGAYYPMHGRNTTTPAENIRIDRFWDGDEYKISISGVVRLAALFSENLVLRRKITTALGDDSLVIEDNITNESGEQQQYMLMYHCNFGFPLVSPDSKVLTNHKRIEFWDERSRDAYHNEARIVEPQSAYAQTVYMHHEPTGDTVKAAIINPEIELGAYVECKKEQLSCFTQWKQLSEQDYVIGLEPGKNHPVGRKKAIETNEMIPIKAGESHQSCLRIGILADERLQDYERGITSEISRAEKKIERKQ